MEMNDQNNPSEKGSTAVKERVKVARPKKYKVLLHNDDYTTMEFVVHVLKNFSTKISVKQKQ